MEKIWFRYAVVMLLLIFSMSICACGKEPAAQSKKITIDTSRTAAAEKEYDEHIIGVIKEIKKSAGTVIVQELMTAAETVLNYTDSFEGFDKYGDIKTINQFAIGDIVDVYFWTDNNEIVKMQNSSSAWIYDDVRKFTIQREKGILKISDHRYQYDPNSLLVVQGEELVDLLTISDRDMLRIQGVGTRIYSITITRGHGYVRFSNYDQFIGGMVEIGYGIIRNVTEDMLLVVPEGNYRMVMEHGRLLAEKQIVVKQGEELTVNLKDYQEEVSKTGEVYFVISPEGAQLNINGVPTVYTDAVELNYGKNIIQVFQEGYTSYTGTLNIKKTSQVVRIDLAQNISTAEVVSSDDNDNEQSLEESNEEEQDTEEQNTEEPTSSDNNNDNDSNDEQKEELEDNQEDTNNNEESNEKEEDSDSEDTTIEAVEEGTTEIDKGHTITINSPKDVKVYVNDEYIGKSPVSFDKIIGTFTVTLSKKGYKTASYTLTMEDDGDSSYLSFPELIETEELS